MLIEFFRWLIGYVDFVVISKFPERFVNIINKNNISIFNVHRKGDKFYASMYIKDYRNVRTFCKKSRARLKVQNRVGLPFFLKAHKNRVGVVLGFLIFILIVYFMSCFVWTIEVSGLKTISNNEIMTALEKNGLAVGTYKKSVDFETIARNTMLDVEDIGWMSINVVGSHASVELKEKVNPPEVKEDITPANIKAKCDGVILSIDALNGTSCLDVGSAVAKDQLIVSGVVEDSRGAVFLVRADARVMAQTSHTKQFLLKKDSEVCSFLPYKKRKKLSVFGLSVPVSFVFADDSTCAKRYLTQNLSIFDTTLPLGISTEFLYEKQSIKKSYSKSECELVFNNNSVLFECFDLSDCVVQNTTSKMFESDDFYIFEVTYSCKQDIAKISEIDAQNLVIEDFVPKENKTQ